jgi:hypothetical protein
MRLKPVLALSLFFAITAAIPIQAQQPCMDLQALVQASLPSPYPIYQYNTWGGNVYAMLGGQLLQGIFSGGGEVSQSHGVNTVGKDGFYKFVFGTDSLTIQFTHAVWPFPPGKGGIGEYKGEGRIAEGTGRFANAWGNVAWSGPFIVWVEGQNVYARCP